MKIDKTGRETLKSYFVKNAVPTASNFEELIGAALNQRDDGLAKPPGEPLSLQADGDDSSQKKLLNLYRNFNDAKPAFGLALSPRADPRNPATARAGLGVTDGDGNPRLFIDQTTGQVGVGTVTPGAQLHVNGALRLVGNLGITPDPDSRMANSGQLQIKGNAPQIDFIDTEHGDWSIHVNSGRMYFIREPWNHTDLVLDGKGNLGIGTPDPRAKLEIRDGALMVSAGNSADRGIVFPPDPGGGGGDSAWIRYYPRVGESTTLEIGTSNDGDDHIALMPGLGNVGIGTTAPAGKLHVQTGGAGTWDRFIVNTTQFWGDKGSEYVTIGAGGAAGIMFFNPHVVWYEAEKRASIRMGRSGGVGGGHWWDIGVRAGNDFSIIDGHNGRFGLGINEAGVVKVNVLQLGEKWRFSGVGDWGGNDEWLRMSTITNGGYSGGFAAGKFWSASNYQGSDARTKRDVQPLASALDAVRRLRGVRFHWNADADDSNPAVGLIAQEVEAVYPEAVSVGPEGLKGVNYAVLVAPLIEAVKQQQAQIEALAARLAAVTAQPAG
ncbi:tail fiber domain-containing protein [Pseudaquabacterium pictum]|uniref:Peptidase S74 domain-containing protein n=1 Tax=Pseudaquabacterium pictum TaxID=2315236 RepID=A0A480AH02_9BURK|nr:tail fiber domain-containing protein [Rubrivivax pictus]GCL60934.1 hypothetical protein AQPW35_00150 [Rubrivivax pictus]